MARASFWSKEANPFLSNGESATFLAFLGAPDEEELEAIFLKKKFEFKEMLLERDCSKKRR